jgi:hypothetical protein
LNDHGRPVVGGGVVVGELTVRVTGSVTELGEVADEVNVTVPWYVPGVDGTMAIDMGSEVGVVSTAVSTESQLPPELVVALSVNVTADPLPVDTVTDCDEGAAAPTVAVKLRPAELTVSVGGVTTGGGIGVVTVSVTGTDNGLFEALLFVNETLPW